MNGKIYDAEDIELLARIAALPEDQIDLVDIPETARDSWRYAQRGGLYRPLKQPVTIRLDADVIAWFKDHAADGGYQTEINRVLRRHVAEAENKRV